MFEVLIILACIIYPIIATAVSIYLVEQRTKLSKAVALGALFPLVVLVLATKGSIELLKELKNGNKAA